MSILRSGPPTTHDAILWRVPLSAAPSAAWQKAFQSAGAPDDARSPKRVHFEPQALTFRSDETDVVEWVGAIDRWIAQANGVEAKTDDARRDATEQAQMRTDVRRQQASDANERFKDL